LTSGEGDEALVSASVASNEDLDFLEEDLLQSAPATSTGYMGRSSQVQWLRALETKVDQPEGEPLDLPYGPPGTSDEASDKRADALHRRQLLTESKTPRGSYFTDYYFYLDNTNIDIDIGDPHIVPSADTARRLFGYYKAAVHSPFHILDDTFETQLDRFYAKAHSSVPANVCSKWKAVMNLVFAIGARYSHLVGAEWQADDRDHLVYMWRAVSLLELGSINTLISQPDQLIIQVSQFAILCPQMLSLHRQRGFSPSIISSLVMLTGLGI
jgi:hypothetical protein